MALCLFTEPSMGGGRAAPPPHGMLPAVTRRATALRYMTYLAIPSWLVFVFSFLAMTLAASIGALVSRRRPVQIEAREDFGIILAATLTLLGLVIGFSFSMALSRYDQRKNYEEAEANAIGTEYMRGRPAAGARRDENPDVACALPGSANLVLFRPRRPGASTDRRADRQ